MLIAKPSLPFRHQHLIVSINLEAWLWLHLHHLRPNLPKITHGYLASLSFQTARVSFSWNFFSIVCGFNWYWVEMGISATGGGEAEKCSGRERMKYYRTFLTGEMIGISIYLWQIGRWRWIESVGGGAFGDKSPNCQNNRCWGASKLSLCLQEAIKVSVPATATRRGLNSAVDAASPTSGGKTDAEV